MSQVVTRVPKSTQDEMQAAVESAKAAFKTWSRTSVLTRQQVMFKYQQLIKDNIVGYCRPWRVFSHELILDNQVLSYFVLTGLKASILCYILEQIGILENCTYG